jgi:hypothetical protein
VRPLFRFDWLNFFLFIMNPPVRRSSRIPVLAEKRAQISLEKALKIELENAKRSREIANNRAKLEPFFKKDIAAMLREKGIIMNDKVMGNYKSAFDWAFWRKHYDVLAVMIIKGYVTCDEDAFDNIMFYYKHVLNEMQWLIIRGVAARGLRPTTYWENKPIRLQIPENDTWYTSLHAGIACQRTHRTARTAVSPGAVLNVVQFVSEHATEQEFTKAALTTRARSWRVAAALKRRILCLEAHVSGDPAYDPDLLWRVSSPLDIGKRRLLDCSLK